MYLNSQAKHKSIYIYVGMSKKMMYFCFISFRLKYSCHKTFMRTNVYEQRHKAQQCSLKNYALYLGSIANASAKGITEVRQIKYTVILC